MTKTNNKKFARQFHTVSLLTLSVGGGFAGVAAAQTPTGGVPGAMLQLLPLVLIFGVFWFLLIRPQMKKQKEHQALVAAVKKGDDVILSSGVYGKVSQIVDETRVEVEIASGVKVKVAKNMLADVLNKPVAVAKSTKK